MATDRHVIRWYGILRDGERVPRNGHMKGGDWSWEAVCSCGWESRTGGAIQERIREYVGTHRYDVLWNERHPEAAREYF